MLGGLREESRRYNDYPSQAGGTIGKRMREEWWWSGTSSIAFVGQCPQPLPQEVDAPEGNSERYSVRTMYAIDPPTTK